MSTSHFLYNLSKEEEEDILENLSIKLDEFLSWYSNFQNKEKIQQQQRKHSLIEEETQEQVQLEHAIEEARELRQQLDEAGRIGLQLYEENVRLK